MGDSKRPGGQAISARIWRADDLGGAELLRGRFADYSYDVHTHDKACFALITRGSIRIRLRGGEFTARAGDLFAIDADEPHAGWPVDEAGWRQRTLYADLGAMGEAIAGKRCLVHTALARPVIRDARLTALFKGVHACSESAGPILKRQQRYLDFVQRLFARHMKDASQPPPPSREDRAIAEARAFLDERLDAQLRLGDIAEAVGLPPFRLYRAFERATGMSPQRGGRIGRICRSSAPDAQFPAHARSHAGSLSRSVPPLMAGASLLLTASSPDGRHPLAAPRL